MPAQLDDETWIRLAQAAYEKNLAACIEKLNERLTATVIKGWSVSRFYDKGHPRLSTDLDILVHPSEQPALLKEIQTLPKQLAIDAHFGPRHLDKLSFDELFERSYEADLDGVPVRVLGDEDNLRITAVHWLTDGGVYREKLWDIYYLVKNRKADFDWEQCLEAAGPVRKTWVIAAIATARHHLSLDISDLPDDVRGFELPRWYQRTLATEWRRGPYPRRILSTVITKPKLLFEQIYRKFPPNRIAASIDTETPIDASWRIPAQIKSVTRKFPPFARGVLRRLGYNLRGDKE